MNKELMRAAGFNKEVDAVERGICPSCDRCITALKFRDEKSKKEHKISGLCQKCQDKVFGKEQK